jgi:hypothetical protein
MAPQGNDPQHVALPDQVGVSISPDAASAVMIKGNRIGCHGAGVTLRLRQFVPGNMLIWDMVSQLEQQRKLSLLSKQPSNTSVGDSFN